jgi:hypothetical protein
MKIKYTNLASFFSFFSHFCQLKTFNIVSFSSFKSLNSLLATFRKVLDKQFFFKELKRKAKWAIIHGKMEKK